MLHIIVNRKYVNKFYGNVAKLKFLHRGDISKLHLKTVDFQPVVGLVIAGHRTLHKSSLTFFIQSLDAT
jgi:hypothetical protein